MSNSSSSSSIQKRRQQHRRQQSLEVPILTQPLPGTHRRTQRPHQGHRRGLSLDQSLSAVSTPTGFRPLQHPQEHPGQYPGSPMISITPDTNPGHHQMQGTQQQPSQPGLHQPLPAQDFQTHLQQQLNGIVNNDITLPPSAEEAQQQLQNHISWFQATYGGSAPALTVSTSTNFNLAHHNMVPMPMAQAPMTPTTPNATLPVHGLPMQAAPVHHGYSHTVPNTPHAHAQGSFSSSQPDQKHVRSQSFQLDTAPMPGSNFDREFMGVGLPQASFMGDAFGNFGSDASYASSVYTSSLVDPMSPHPDHSLTSHMPTVPEEPLMPYDASFQGTSFMGETNNLLNATAGASDDSDDVLHAPQPIDPRQASLAALGDINATIEDTGVSPDQINQYMSEQDPSNNKWTCLFDDCGKQFGRKENIRAHVQTHLGDRQFKCLDCDKRFVRQHDLKRHAKIHTGDKPNTCPCGMSFARQDALTRHRQRDTCFGVMPGYEKPEEEKKKRGRPKKQRPDIETRTEKATRARKMDADNAAREASSDYSSPSSDSGASQASLPVTPPNDESDFANFQYDALLAAGNEAGLDLMSDDYAVEMFAFTGSSDTGSWRVDTPPTSPANSHQVSKTIAPQELLSASSSPQDLWSDYSSPEDFNNFDGGAGDALFVDMLDSYLTAN